MKVLLYISALCCFVCAFSGAATYTVNVFTSSAAVNPAQLQKDFIAATTAHFNAAIIVSPFANTYTLRLFSKNQAVPIQCNTENDCTAISFGAGMDEERNDNIGLVYGMQARDYWAKTCGGYQLSASTTSCFNTCIAAYDAVVSTISLRFGKVFTSTGADAE